MKNLSKSCLGSVERCHSKRISMDREAIENLSSIQKVSRWIKQLSRTYWECDKKQLKWLDRKPNCREVSRSCRDCLKRVFQEEKNTDMNTIKHTNNQRFKQHFKLSKLSLNKKKLLSTWIQNTHTHTKQV